MTDIRTPVDDIPLEVRRFNWGWWGEPWPSYVCYGEDGRLLEEMRKPFPAGESCFWCGEAFEPGDSGQSMPVRGPLRRGAQVVNQHKECLLRQVMGAVTCIKGEHNHDRTVSLREEALATWLWVSQHGSGSGSISP